MHPIDAFTMQRLLAALRALQYEGAVPVCPNEGICCYLARATDVSVDVMTLKLRQYFVQWPEFSGDRAYPVSTNKAVTAMDQYDLASDKEALWSMRTPYGLARWRLVDWLADEFARELGNV
jgi:hypothetical protein